ncbi:MAG: cadherin-like domain-containing protein, partial [Nanoarchaeota archaeon]|nr:cadherin-like domain-containing protein [Nanoarchaeota archaeon]
INAKDSHPATKKCILSLTVKEKEVDETPIEKNHAPTITSNPEKTVNEKQLYSYQVTVEDEDVNSLKYSLISSPRWLSITNKGLITGTAPEVSADKNEIIEIKVTDNNNKNDFQIYTLTIKDVPTTPEQPKNHAPVIISTPTTSVNENSAYKYQVIAKDDDKDDVLTYSLANAPTWLSIDSQTGLISRTAPSVDRDSSWQIIIKVSDGKGGIATQSYLLTVKDISVTPVPVNHQPTASNQVITTDKNKQVTISLLATDTDADVLKYSIFSGPKNGVISSFNSVTGILIYKPNNNFVGSDSFTFKVNDGKLNSNVATVSITVKDTSVIPPVSTNNRPVIHSTPTTSVNEKENYFYQIVATDADSNDVLTYSLSQAPTWLSINSQTSSISGTAPSVDRDSSWQIIIKVSDGKGGVTTQSYLLTVKNILIVNPPANHAPRITSTPVTSVNENSSYSYQVTAADEDGDSLTYSLINKPEWLSINPVTGLVYGAAPNVDADTSHTITIRVSDGKDSVTQAYALIIKNVEEEKVSTIILGGGKDKKQPAPLIQYDDFYTNKYFDQFDHITLDEQETEQDASTESNLKNILFVLLSLIIIVVIISLVTVLVRRL